MAACRRALVLAALDRSREARFEADGRILHLARHGQLAGRQSVTCELACALFSAALNESPPGLLAVSRTTIALAGIAGEDFAAVRDAAWR